MPMGMTKFLTNSSSSMGNVRVTQLQNVTSHAQVMTKFLTMNIPPERERKRERERERERERFIRNYP